MAILYDGRKKTNIDNLPEEAWEYLSGGGQGDGLKELQQKIPWLYQGMKIRAQAVAGIPFSIYKGEAEYDTSDDWQNKIEVLPDPKKIFKLTEMALVLFGKNYLYMPENQYKFKKELRYMMPLTIKAVIDEEEGLTKFKRVLRGRERDIEIEDLLYFWDIDPYVELGPPESSPATAAMGAAGVLMSVDEFATAFFERGAIKATVLGVPPGTTPEEGKRLKKWYSGMMTGIKNAFTAQIINADAVSVTTIGEGIKELENTELTKEKREDIATALGVPQTLLFSQAANYATAQEDSRMFLKMTAVPQAEFIAEVINTQLLNEMGLRLKFRPDAMDEFQADEERRSEAFANYVLSIGKDKASIIAEMLGLELPEGVEYTDLDSEPMPMPEFGEKPENEPDEEKEPKTSPICDDLEKWRRKALNRLKRGKSADCEFVSDNIPHTMTEAIKATLESAETESDVNAVFDAIISDMPLPFM